MASKKPNLSLVAARTDRAASGVSLGDGFNLVSLAELSATERTRVERLVESACPHAGVLAVARQSKTWDLRPVVALAGEDGPSLIRALGPDLAFAPEVARRVKAGFQRLSTFSDLRSGLLDWNQCENQLWFRRLLVPRTLSHELSGNLSLDADQVFALIATLFRQLSDWHSHGVVHGHLSSSNIVLADDGSVVLIDAGAAAATAQAAKEIPAELLRTIAPELRRSSSLTSEADVYGLGQVIRRLLLAVRKKYQFNDQRDEVAARSAALTEIVSQMIAEDPGDRPALGALSSIFEEADQVDVPQSAVRPAQGRIVQRGAMPRGGAYGEKSRTVASEQESVSEVQGRADVTEAFESDTQPAPVSMFSDDPLEVFVSESHDALEEHHVDVQLDEAVLTAPLKHSRRTIRQARGVASASEHSAAQSGLGFGTFAFGLSLLLAVIYFSLKGAPWSQETIEYNLTELRIAWQSKIPSRMLTVAEVALEADADVKPAQDLIVASANNGEESPAVDIGLLRIAFDSRWEVELESEDRRMAIAFALARLLGARAPRDFGALSDRHPGVILAVTASAGENMKRILDQISAERLTQLPPPFGPAFRRLLEANAKLTCADPAIQFLARFQARGVERAEDLALYLQENAEVRLQALAIMFSQNNYAAKMVLEQLLNHPNIVLNHNEIVWARSWDLMGWQELEPSDQLFVLAGAPPAELVKTENIAKLFLHPNPDLRAYAIDQALNRVKFNHPGAVAILGMLKATPEMLNSEQLARLAALLQDPAEADEKKIQALLVTEPPVEVVAQLLLSTRAQSTSSSLDTWAAMYLNSKDWKPGITELRNLSMHPDKYTRLFAYNHILQLDDEKTARVFLETALSQEQDPEYRERLELMIGQLK